MRELSDVHFTDPARIIRARKARPVLHRLEFHYVLKYAS